MPVIVWTGFLGSGKTTILQGVLGRLPPSECAMTLVNDLSPDNIDAPCFASGRGRGVRALSGGCVCCNLLGDLVAALLAAADEAYDVVMLECTGVADVHPIAATIAALPALASAVYLKAIVTVVHGDALSRAAVRGEGGGVDIHTADVRHQIDGSNIVLINNWESVARSAEEAAMWAAAVETYGRQCNPHVRVLFTDHGRFDYDAHLRHSDLFEEDGVLPLHLRRYAQSGGRVGEFGSAEEAAGELESMGAAHFTLPLAAMCVSLRALRAALASAAGKRLLRGVWRSKGYFRATDDEEGGGAPCVFRWQTVERRMDYGELRLAPSQPPPALAIVFIGKFDAAVKRDQAEGFFHQLTVTTE